LGVDAKRIHLFHKMFNADEGYLAATHELMLLHVDQTIGKTSPMPDDILENLQALRDVHGQLALPEQVGAAVRRVRL